jgi:hypothetical protein
MATVYIGQSKEHIYMKVTSDVLNSVRDIKAQIRQRSSISYIAFYISCSNIITEIWAEATTFLFSAAPRPAVGPT